MEKKSIIHITAANTQLALLFSCLLIFCTISPSLANNILLDHASSHQQLFTADHQTLTISGDGDAQAGVLSTYRNSTLIIRAKDNKGVSHHATRAIENVANIKLESGHISNSGYYSIFHNVNNEDLSIDVAQKAKITSNLFTIFASASNAYSDKTLHLNNQGLIQSRYPIVTQRINLNINNSGTITSLAPGSSILSNGYASNLTQLNNSGVINGGIFLRSRKSYLINSGDIIGDIGTESNPPSFDYENAIIITQNAGSITGNIALGLSDDSAFVLNGGEMNGNLIIAGGEYGADRYSAGSEVLGLNQNIFLNGGVMNGDVLMAAGATLNLGLTDLNGAIISHLHSTDHYLAPGFVNIIASRDLDAGITLGSDGRDEITITNNADVVLNGADIDAHKLTVDANASFTLNSNATINETILHGRLSFTDSGKRLTGDVYGSGSAILDIGHNQNNIQGDLTLKAGDHIILSANNSGSLGKLTVDGAFRMEAGVTLGAGTGSNYTYLADGSSHVLIDGGTGSAIAAISNANINNNLATLRFSTAVSDDGSDLIVHVKRVDASQITSNSQHQAIYNTINNIGANAQGSLKTLQSYLDNATSTKQVTKALESTEPQDNSSTKLINLSVATDSIKTIENRMDAIHLSSLSPENSDAATSGISSGNNALGFDIWGQTFATKAKQKNIDENGYESTSNGLAFGVDFNIDKDFRSGIAFSYATADTDSSNRLKSTDIDIYQINLAASRSYGKYFIGGILGFSWNEYHTSRRIESANVNADAKYHGQNYIAKFKTGATYHNINNSDFNIAPEISSTFINSRTSSYTENGADTLNLHVRKNSDEFLEGRLGVNISHTPIRTNHLTGLFDKVEPALHLSYGYNFLNKRQVTVSNFLGQTASFHTVSSDVSPGSFQAGLGLKIYKIDSTSLTLNYLSERRHNYVSHSGLIKIKHGF